MASNEFLTTGQTADLLKVSRSTVSRKYDQGLIRGQTNPITGERMISRDSVVSLMRQYNIPVPEQVEQRKPVLSATPDTLLQGQILDMMGSDERIAVEQLGSGCEALVACSKKERALVILDADLPDIACSDVIKTLRANAEIPPKIVCIADEDKRSEALQWNADAVVLRQSFDGEEASAQVYQTLGLPVRPARVKSRYEHFRQWPRVTVDLPVTLSVFPLSAPKTRNHGTAMIRDISCGGVLLSHVQLENAALPLEPFRVILQCNEPPLTDWRAHAQVVRLRSGDPISLALQFVKIAKPDLEKVQAFVNEQQG